MTKQTEPRKSSGASPMTAERRLYLQLMAQGINNSKACRIVGINRRTGTRWRYGRTETTTAGRQVSYPPLVQPEISDRYLSQEERLTIADLLRAGKSVRRIAAELGRSPSTVSREVTRNRDPGSGQYRPFAAHAQSAARRPRPKQRKFTTNAALRAFVQNHLEKRWSPEQITRILRLRFPNQPEMHVAHETIYQALYLQGRGELRRELTRALRTGRARRKPRRAPDSRRPRFGDDMVMISERPADVQDRAVPGHSEGDRATRGRMS